MDAFDKFGEELVEAGERRRLAREGRRPKGPDHPRRPLGRRLVLAAVAVAAVAIAAAVVAVFGGGSIDTAAKASQLLARTRRATAGIPACRAPRPGASAVLSGAQGGPATRGLLSALRRPQTSRESQASEALAGTKLSARASAVLGGSLRMLAGPEDSSTTVAVTRRLAGITTHADPIACGHLQLAAAMRLGRHASPSVLAHVKAIIIQELGQEHLLIAMPAAEEIYVAFHQGRRTVATALVSLSAFARRGAVATYRLSGAEGAVTRVRGLLPDRAASAALVPSAGPHVATVALAIEHNTIAASIPLALGREPLLVLRDGRGHALARIKLHTR